MPFPIIPVYLYGKKIKMKKRFNITGVCYPEKHYMMDIQWKLDEILELIEYGEYFTINRPRQYGKSTILYFISEKLSQSAEYLPIALNFQGIDEKWHKSDEMFARMFIQELATFFEFSHPKIASFIQGEETQIVDMNSLSKFVTRLVKITNKKLVLLIDEVDASSNYEPFLSFLGMLRTKFLARTKLHHSTFHSIILAGVHDVKSLKYKLRNQSDTQYNSPWNIAVDFKVDMSFNPREIAPMLVEYSQAESVDLDISSIADHLHYHTSGYPFLVSRLCKIIAEDIIPQKDEKTWTLDDVEKSVQILLQENNTNFDSLIKNLENHQDLYDLVFRIVIDGASIGFNQYNPVIYKGILYGIFKRNGKIRIHNRIYEQLIYDYMASKVEVNLQVDDYNFENQFYLPNNQLDVEKILIKFQQFMREQYSEKDQAFLEREWRLIFLAFIKPIINGNGHDFKEPQISAEKRLDIVITFFQHKYIVELKRWNGEKLHQEGLDQLTDYLKRQTQDKGYLVIFEYRTPKTWRAETIQHQGKEIFGVWV